MIQLRGWVDLEALYKRRAIQSRIIWNQGLFLVGCFEDYSVLIVDHESVIGNRGNRLGRYTQFGICSKVSCFCSVTALTAFSKLITFHFSNCQLGCPEGWVRLAFSRSCYKLPSQPAQLDSFWNHDKRCKELDPAAYIMVPNTVVGQVLARSLAL